MSIQQLTFNAIAERQAGGVGSSWTLSRLVFAISITAGYAALGFCYLGMARLI